MANCRVGNLVAMTLLVDFVVDVLVDVFVPLLFLVYCHYNSWGCDCLPDNHVFRRWRDRRGRCGAGAGGFLSWSIDCELFGSDVLRLWVALGLTWLWG